MSSEMEVSVHTEIWDSVRELTKLAQRKGSDPLLWALQISSNLNSAGVALPSVELADVLVSYICWENNLPSLWKFLEKALILQIVPPMFVLALLSTRVIPCRHSRPAAYRLYLELLKRHAFTLKYQINGLNYQKVMKSIDDVLHLSQRFGMSVSEPGILVVEFIFSIVWQLLDATLDDEGLLELTLEKRSAWAAKSQEMEIDYHDSYDEKRAKFKERLQNVNTVTAIELIGQFLQNKVTSRIIYLARRNMHTHWVDFIQRLRLLEANSSALRNSKALTPEALNQLTSDTRIVLSRECKTTSLQKFHGVMAFGSLSTSAGLCQGASRSALWLPLDLLLEDAMDGYLVNATSAIEIITGLIKTLQAINGTTWHDTFLGLWIAALRLVQRERDPIGGPVPRLDTRLCILLSITTLVIADLIEEEEKISAHAVFSNAFILLLKLWRFNHPPLEHGVGGTPTVGSQLTPEYLLLLRNSHLVYPGNANKNRNRRRLSAAASSSSPQPVFVDSFPKLKAWYRQHQACIASTLSGLVHGTPVHQIVDGLLNMMFKKINRGSQSLISISVSSSSSGSGNEDTSLRPKLPAWDILEAVPFVVDAALTACAHGKLSPRELATGLKDLADFLPASLATIVSYFSAEVTRGVWKPVFMNGTDWPSPAANLSNVEEQIKKILATTGVDIPSPAAGGSSPSTLPLPLAAFVSLTITYKIDRASERFLNLAGPALESLAAGCPWPCMPIVASLWTQKAKHWSDFLVFSASRTVFLHNSDAMVQLLKSCFTATLGLNAMPISSSGGVGALLGHGFGSHFCGGISPVAPGILYLRVYRSIRDIVFITEEVVSLLMHSVREIVSSGIPRERLEKLRTSKIGMRYRQVSLAAAMTRVKLAAALGASLVWLSGGLSLVQSLIKETLPSLFISVHRSEQEEGSEGMVAMLGGYALAYFVVLCGAFAWGVDSTSSASKRRPKILGTHLEFLASAVDGKISLGCDWATWRAYVSGFVTLMVGCTPNWVLEVNGDVLKRLSNGLRQWDEEELALALLGIGGVGTMGAAAELIIENDM
ncbi:hypothetical protein I3842_01G157900 [Carya illinoinensis]|uniref:Mediator of RNA polymerase II transcription subunit 33A n=1 Tax=Carya illinoinensis TaxID=32201 RepID=A0A922G0Z3_CARIL|nr:hypothetical protein I3842_01G157900 [Carya illinoinensis]